MGKIRILVADDHPAFREGLRRCLEDEKDLQVVAESADGEETVALARELQPDVSIIDVSMPKLNGVEAARQIRVSSPTAVILMISAFDNQSYILSSLQAGAAGYMLKTAPLSDIISAIRLVHAGKAVFDLRSVGKILDRFSRDTGERGEINSLQPRELEVIRLVAKGMSNKEIASKLGISGRTVQTHLVNVFKKLGASSRTEAVLCALREGWIALDELPARSVSRQ